ncbi:hypothetical protein [Streptomyces sp. NRRL WC-3742]|uniref:hypothetical protein n=1 Tax=Streptomyces sp. NRRL WC-3742 TaxID=1463934 RepID=UPI0004CAC08A|nr:hypothetical protein [Streptomyces sp. NRRL WC-3742]
MTTTRTSRRLRAAAVPVAALTVLTALVATACSSGSDSKAPAAASVGAQATSSGPSAPATPDATSTTTPAKPGAPTLPSVPGTSGGGGSLTLSGSGGGTYEFDKVGCVGEAKPGGLLTVTGTPRSANVLVASVIFKDGQAELLLTVKGSTRPQQWKGRAAVGEHASRTGDSAKLTDFPVKEELGANGTVSGTLTCSGAFGLH